GATDPPLTPSPPPSTIFRCPHERRVADPKHCEHQFALRTGHARQFDGIERPGIEPDGVGCTRADQERSAGMCSVREGFDGRLGHDGDTLYERLGECGLAERERGLSSAMSPLQWCN